MEFKNFQWLTDPETFAVNRLPAHSDHRYYTTLEQAKKMGDMPLRQSLNGNWKFFYAENLAGVPQDFFADTTDTSAWDSIRVPGHIQMAGYDRLQYINTMYPWDGRSELRPPEIDPDYNPCGCYVTEFTVDQPLQDKPLFISFQGVENAFYLWCNGEFVGYAEDSFTPSEFELTALVRPGANRLAALVCKRSSASWVEDQDFWRFSGIFRPVYLYAKPAAHLQDLFVQTELTDDLSSAELKVDVTIENPQDTRISLLLQDVDGGQAAKMTDIPAEEKTSLSCTVDRPALWSAEQPNLYTLIVILKRGEEVVEAVPERIGFRRFEMKDGVMTLNGKRIVFRGVNRHEFSCTAGRAISLDDMLYDIQFMKRNNINAVRTCHYPNQTEWYRLCDEYGVYLIDETNLESHGSWQKMGGIKPEWVVPGDRPEWQAMVLDRAASMLERDKNHPSVLVWSCGNESFGGKDIFAMSEFFRHRDPSRLVHYEGVFHDRRYNATSDMESRMYAKPADIAAYLDEKPAKPYISCEYMHAMGNSLGGMKKYTDLEDRYEQYQGGFIWDYIDQAVLHDGQMRYGGDFGERPTDYGFCTNGVVYANRTPSPKVQDMKFLYQAIELHPDSDSVRIRNKNLFIDTSRYLFTWTLSVDGQPEKSGRFECSIPPLSETVVPLDIEIPNGPGEPCLTVCCCLKEKTIWAEAGYVVAFGQKVFAQGPAVLIPPAGRVEVIHGDVNLGVKGDGFAVLFSYQDGGMVSLRYDGQEFIHRATKPVYWRATTDNDRGNKLDFRAACWQTADRAQICVGYRVEEQPDMVTISFRYRPLAEKAVETTVSYTVKADGGIGVKADYPGAEGLPELPVFGFGMQLPAVYHNVNFYGMGPDENYIDRAEGARLGVYQTTAAENLSGYVMPQECGNRTGVRWAEITDDNGFGLCLKADGHPFELGVLPYTAQELENAWHLDELPPVHYTNIRVMARQMGVGGDDSWGAPVYDEYRNFSENPLSVSFTIQPKR